LMTGSQMGRQGLPQGDRVNLLIRFFNRHHLQQAQRILIAQTLRGVLTAGRDGLQRQGGHALGGRGTQQRRGNISLAHFGVGTRYKKSVRDHILSFMPPDSPKPSARSPAAAHWGYESFHKPVVTPGPVGVRSSPWAVLHSG